MSLFDYWAVQWNRNVSYPRDFDFQFTEYCYSAIELSGDIVESYCSPDAIIQNVVYTTNDGSSAKYSEWRTLRWLPALDAELPENYAVKRYKVTIYSDAQRTTVLETHQGSFNIYDSKLIDEHDWFPSKIAGCIPNQSLPIGTKVNVYCDILQPRNSELEIYLSIDNAPFSLIRSSSLTDPVRIKRNSFEYDFNSWGTYKFRFKIKTNTLNWINYWCPATEDYIEQCDAIITVGEQ